MEKNYTIFLKKITLLFLFLSAVSGLHKEVRAQNSASKWTANAFEQKVFIENKGQFAGQKNIQDPGFSYFVEDAGAQLYFTTNGLTYVLSRSEYTGNNKDLMEDEEDEKYSPQEEKERENRIKAKRSKKIRTTTSTIRLTWLNANPDAQLAAGDLSPEYYTYHDSRIADMRHPGTLVASAYKKLVYRNLYPNIDVEYTFHKEKGIKYVLLLHPGADLSRVQMQYEGTNAIFSDSGGNIHITTKLGDIMDHAPVTYYGDDHASIASAFVLQGKTVSFQLIGADLSREIVIDPWSVTPAFGLDNKVLDIQHDAAGNLYVYGSQNPYKVRKYNSAGVTQWTYNTTNNQGAGDIATDPAGNTYCTYDMNTILKLDPSGNLIFQLDTSKAMEQWRLSFNNNFTQLVLAGAFLNGSTSTEHMAYVDMNTGLLSNLASYQTDHRSLTVDQNGIYYILSASVTPITTLVALSPALVQQWAVLPLYNANYNPGPLYNNSFPTWPVAGQNALATYCNYVYLFNGVTLYKYNSANGGLVGAPVAVPGGSLENNSGIAIDNCGNVYVGSQAVVHKYSPSLALLGSSAPIVGAIYDITINTNGDVVACGNNVVTAINLTACAPLTLSVSTTASNCTSTTATATATVTGGSPPYTYSWSDGQVTSAATGLSSGTYTVTVSDGSSCVTQSAMVTINASAGISSVATTSVNIACNGQNNGSASVTPAGGNSPFTYSWSNGQSTSAISGLGPGTYSVLITDASGCTNSSQVTITQPPAITVTTSITQASCGISNGSITAIPSGGTGAFTYAWTAGGQTSATATGLAAGLYTVTVTDAKGCTKVKLVSVSNANGPNTTMAQTNIICNGQCTGSASASVVGGASPYTFQWAGGQSTSAVSNLCAGTYTMIVTDNAGCTNAQAVTITQPAAITITMSITNATCGASNGTATANTSGGTPVYTYSWSNGQSSSTATGLSVGSYTVTVGDVNGCTQVQSVSITNISGPAAVMSQTNVKCNGQCNGAASAAASGGTQPYTYSWANGQTTSAANNLCAGTYTVSVTDGSGCMVTSSVTITQPASVLAATPTSTPATCGLNDGTASANASGGTPAYTYLWNTGNTTATVSGLGVGSYTVTVIDGNGCLTAQSVSVINLNGPVATMSQSNIMCNGQCVGTASAGVTGGQSPYTYAWSNAQSTSSVSALCAGNYTVVVSDAAGCTDMHVITITQPLTAIAVNPTVVNASCGMSDGSADANASGGTPAYTYSWSNGQTSPTTTGLAVGIYTVTVTDMNGCTQIATAQVNNNSGPAITSSSFVNPLCNGTSNGSAGVVATGSGLSYAWTPTALNSPSVSGLPAGSYTVIVTDGSGCSAIQLFTLTQPAAITATTSATPTSCGNSNGSTSATASGGTGTLSYFWIPGGQVTASVGSLNQGTYTVIVTDANGCIQSATAVVGGTPSATVNAGVDVLILTGDTTNLSAVAGTGAVTYSWTPSVGLSCSNCANPTASPLQTTQYCVTVTDTNGCTASDCVTITVETPCPENAAIDLPTAFTPNGDGHNDRFFIAGLNSCVTQYNLVIFNRWGEKVFESSDLTVSWDGTFHGRSLDPGVFVYYFSAVFTNKQSVTKKGNISLIR